MPRPNPSTPALLLMQVRPVTPDSFRAQIRASGMPHRPNPPTASTWLSATTPRRASTADGNTFCIGIYRLMTDGMVLPRGLHARIVRAAAAFRRHPDDVLRRVLDVAGLAMHAVLR